jgi:hypothetical protein
VFSKKYAFISLVTLTILRFGLRCPIEREAPPTCKTQTTLHGLASKFVSALVGADYSNPISSDDVLAIFRSHGIKGNPSLRLDDDAGPQPTIPLV